MLKLPRRGFTLVELLIAVTILATLSAFGIATYQGAQTKARDTKIKADIDAIAKAFESTYDIKTGRYGEYGEMNGSNFSGGSVPVQSNGSPYPSMLTPDRKYFEVSSTLSNGQLYTKVSALAFPPTATPTATNTPTTAHTPTPTPTSTPTGTPTPLNRDLVGYWDFSTDTGSMVYDLSGNNNHGTWYGSGVHGEVFNGADDYIDLSAHASNFPSGNSPKSLCVYASTNDLNQRMVFAYGSGNNFFGIGLIGDGSPNGKLSAGHWPYPLQIANIWYTQTGKYICVTYDGSTDILYADGNWVGQISKNVNLVSSNAYIGRQPNGYEHWKGNIYKVRLYSRVLSPAEIRTMADGKL